MAMASLENAPPTKRTPVIRSVGGGGSGRSFLHRPRSKLARFLLFERVDYLQLILTALVFFLVIILFQAFLPSSAVERSAAGDAEGFLAKIGGLDFGEGIRFLPSKLEERWEKERRERNSSSLGRPVRRIGLRRPLIALVVPELWADGAQLEMISIAAALKDIGYDIEVYSLSNGPTHTAWRAIGMHVNILPVDMRQEVNVDWLEYNGILVSSLDSRPVISCLLQEPFKSIPVIWTINEKSLALRLSKYTSNGQNQLISDWKEVFSRATVVVFPTHSLPMMYSAFDAGNYFVVPSSAEEAWRAENYAVTNNEHDLRVNMGYRLEDFLIAIVGSQFSYSGTLLEYSLVLQALAPLLQEFPADNTALLKVGIVSRNSTSTYKTALETIGLNFGYPRGSLQHIVSDENEVNFLGIANIVIYGSFLEEQSFPPILLQAMTLGKLVIAPDLGMIRNYVDNGINGYLYRKKEVSTLRQILLQAISRGKLSPSAQKIASVGRQNARNLMVSDTIQSYALLLDNVLKLPSEVASPKGAAEISLSLREEWQWHFLENVTNANDLYRMSGRFGILDKIEEQWNRSHEEGSTNAISWTEEALVAWEEVKKIEMVNAKRRIEEQELKDRTDQPHGTWEEVYKNAKKIERAKNELHERDDRELERTGQPLCIYEPYLGEGSWPFLHNTSLYRGIGLSSKGCRTGGDDINASSRLPLLRDSYYRDTLGEHGAFFSLANQIDRIHKNAWIGFQSWRLVARKDSLSKKAETALLDAIQSRRHGDSLYFWARMDKDRRNPFQYDFWSFCDAINAGNCRFAVSEALQRMYGVQLPHNWDSLPKMPTNGDSWSVMHSWALPTRSFLEFVMFSRMFVDALDAQMYDEHHGSGHCYLSLTKDRHCYSRVLELLVNVWAYHSARRMIYVNPDTGAMQEHHKLKSRRGQMWIKWFSFATLKSMDEDLAEESDSERPHRRWLWPLTGEIFWQGIYERERNMRNQQKEKRRQQNKDKLERIRKRARQKTIGKYIKPQPGGTGNTTTTH
ncbi:uncharacterized protein M6B38_257805 [Iris pallida]|uniref:Glycosyl transferase family 1 domain-containing protein n=1 Tax=Iris pallida TaxID=29817 RepID=A0AAX6IEY2_IRIPA|nr:uncharacterized protein M6B38_257805 [Iris pallida]